MEKYPVSQAHIPFWHTSEFSVPLHCSLYRHGPPTTTLSEEELELSYLTKNKHKICLY